MRRGRVDRLVAMAISLLALAIAGVHLRWPALAIDATTLTLLVIAALPWILPFLKSIELPGGITVELRDVMAATEQLTASLAPVRPRVTRRLEQMSPGLSHFAITPDYGTSLGAGSLRVLDKGDPGVALVTLTTDVERMLRQLADRLTIDTRTLGPADIVHELRRRDLIDGPSTRGILSLLAMGRKAAEGALVSDAAAEWVRMVGPDVLDALDGVVAGTPLRGGVEEAPL